MLATAAKPKEIAKDLYLKGVSSNQIASQLSVSPDCVRQWVFRGKWAAEKEQLTQIKYTPQDYDVNAVAVELNGRVVVLVRRLLATLESLKAKGLRDCKDASVALASLLTTGRKALGLDDDRGPQTLSLTIINSSSAASRPVIDVQVEPQPAQIAPQPVVVEPPAEKA